MSNNEVKILLCEDEPSLGSIIMDVMEAHNYKVTLCNNGRDGLKAYREQKFDLCLLDVMMPQMDGITLAKTIRSEDPNMPIIFLTALAERENILEGFRTGADDYISKPFNIDELLLRIEAVLRRAGKQDSRSQTRQEVFRLGNFVFNTTAQTLTLGDHVQRLTTKECELLALLTQFANNLLEREHALKVIWGIHEPVADPEHAFSMRSMDVYITKLRRMLAGDSSVEIKNVHGKGYKLVLPDNV